MENNFDQSDVIEIDLVELMGVLLQKLWILIVGALGAGLAAFLISVYVLTPKYESVTKIYIINRQSTESLTYSDLQSGTQLTKDYKALVTSRPVMEEVIAQLGLDTTVEGLINMITVDVPTDTRIVSITVENADPYLARDIANNVRTSASTHIENVMNTEAVNVVEDANLPTEPSTPNIIKNTAIGGIGGLALAMAIIILIYIMDDSIKNPDDVENYLHLSVLGSIPDMEEAAKRDKKGKKKKRADSETMRDSVYRAEAHEKLSKQLNIENASNTNAPAGQAKSNAQAVTSGKTPGSDSNKSKSGDSGKYQSGNPGRTPGSDTNKSQPGKYSDMKAPNMAGGSRGIRVEDRRLNANDSKR